MAITSRRLTLDELLDLPEEKPALEYADGVVTQKVAPQAFHGRIQYKFAETVNLFGEPRRLAMAFTETRSVFGGRAYVPDVGIFTWTRLPRQPNGKLINAFRTPWDIAVEIVSPDQHGSELETKCLRYLANGVEIALMTDPETEDIIRYVTDGSRVELRGDDPIDLDSVLPGFALTPAELFATPYPG